MKVAAFDLDGTLIDSMGVWKILGPDYLRSIGIEPTKDLRKELKSLSLLEGCYYCKEKYGIEKSAEEMNADLEKILEDYYENKFQLKPYALETLESLREKGVRICLATATEDRLVEALLNRLKIDDYFEFIQTSNNSGVGKNDKKFFEILIDRLEEEPEHIWLFEDAVHSIESAKECGIKIVAINDGNSEKEENKKRQLADIYIDDFSQLDLNKFNIEEAI